MDLKLDKTENLTTDKSFIESNENLVRVFAKHYNMLEYIHTDKKDEKIKRDYNFIKPDKCLVKIGKKVLINILLL